MISAIPDLARNCFDTKVIICASQLFCRAPPEKIAHYIASLAAYYIGEADCEGVLGQPSDLFAEAETLKMSGV